MPAQATHVIAFCLASHFSYGLANWQPESPLDDVDNAPTSLHRCRQGD